MSASKIVTVVIVLCALSSAAVFGGGDSMSIVVNRLMLEGYTTDQIEKMKAYPEWPAYDETTGLLKEGPQKFISPDYRLAVVYHVSNSSSGQTIKRQVKYDYSKNK